MSHAWRPLFVVIGLVALILVVRAIIVPADFQAKNGDYKYQWHRVGNEEDWKNFKVKYQGRDYCKDCHSAQYGQATSSKHALVQCENCHGPAIEHPVNPAKLTIDKSRELCLRCHAKLPYRPAVYAGLPAGPIPLKMQDGEQHNPGIECVTCHDVHRAGFKGGK
ncbi:MAG: cytochrome c3 family protein [Thermodesulfovibrionales bacterium]|nr:cytochrome c3 family protein [Thermodesulfovibrionales bacterium]